MARLDARCLSCGHVFEFVRAVADWPKTPACEQCGEPTEHAHVSSQEYRPFKPYFDVALGQEITSFAQRESVRRSLQADFCDQPRAGDLSARQDKMHEDRRERMR